MEVQIADWLVKKLGKKNIGYDHERIRYND